MFQYIVRRVLQFIPVFFGVTLILFLIATYLPGADPVQLRMGEKAMDPARKAIIKAQLGLDRPWYVQYGDYLSGLSMMHAMYYDGSPATGEAAIKGQPKVAKEVGSYLGLVTVVQGSVPATGATKYSPRDGVFVTRGEMGRVALGNLTFEFDPIDLGNSLYQGRPVRVILAERYPFTVELALAAILLEIIFGIAVGIISAIKQYSVTDIVVTLLTSILVSVPVFWLGLMLQYAFGIWLKKATGGALALPVAGAGGDAFSVAGLPNLILPAITLASVSTAYAARIMRSQLLEVMGQDYIRTARAKGLSERKVLWSHAIKNAMIPVVTFIGLDFGAMLAGAILTETVFTWPGVGSTIYKAIVGKDFYIVFGGVTALLLVVMIVNLAVDISYAFLDPRIRYGGGGE